MQKTPISASPAAQPPMDRTGRWLAGLTQPLAGEGPWDELHLIPA